MQRWFILLILILLSLLGCATTDTTDKDTSAKKVSTSISKIEKWVENDLLPLLVKKIKNNPNLKNKAFTIAAWDVEKNSINTQVDDLTKEIRERLSAGLLKHRVGGYIPLSLPKPLVSTHHNRLADINCGGYRNIEMYVLINTRISALNDNLIIRVQGAFPRGEGFEFIPGLSEIFECTASSRIKTTIAQTKAANYLRGLRYLPFDISQKDFLSSYLAHRVSCIFKNMSKGDELIVFMDRSRLGEDVFLNDTFNILEMYLDKFHEIRMVSDRSSANVIMYCKAIPIDTELCQVWLTTEMIKGGIKIGASTETYIKKK